MWGTSLGVTRNKTGRGTRPWEVRGVGRGALDATLAASGLWRDFGLLSRGAGHADGT